MEKREPKRKIQRENEQAAPVEAPIDPATGFPWPKMTIDRAGGNVLVGTTVTPFPAKSLTWIELLNFAEHPGQTLTSGQIEHVAAINHSLGTPGATLVSTLRGRFGEKADSFLFSTVKEQTERGMKPVGFRLQTMPEFPKPRAFKQAIREARSQAAYLTEVLTPESDITRLDMAAIAPALVTNLYHGIKPDQRRVIEATCSELIGSAKDFIYGKAIAQVREQALWKLARFAVSDTDHLRAAIAEIPDIRVKTLLFRLVLGPERNILLQERIDQILADNALADAERAERERHISTSQAVFEQTAPEEVEEVSLFDLASVAVIFGSDLDHLREIIETNPVINDAYSKLQHQIHAIHEIPQANMLDAQARAYKAFAETARDIERKEIADQLTTPTDQLAIWLYQEQRGLLTDNFIEFYYSEEAKRLQPGYRTLLLDLYDRLRVNQSARPETAQDAQSRRAAEEITKNYAIEQRDADIRSILDSFVSEIGLVMPKGVPMTGAMIQDAIQHASDPRWERSYGGGWARRDSLEQAAERGLIKPGRKRVGGNYHATYTRADIVKARYYAERARKIGGLTQPLIKELDELVRMTFNTFDEQEAERLRQEQK